MRVKRGEDLDVWRWAIQLVNEVYQLAKRLPDDEQFGLISQMRRAAVLISTFIAEDAARNHASWFLRHLSMAKGSLAELEIFFATLMNRHI